MGKFKVTDSNTGKSYVITAPDQTQAMAAFQKFTGAAQPVNETRGLAIPGTSYVPEGAPPIGVVPPNESFGLRSSDTLNPLPALSAMGNNIASNVPILGPHLQQAGERFDAFVDNNVYRPITGQPGTTTTQDVAATNARQSAANPIPTVVGSTVGKVGPYMAAAEIPAVSQALGFAGPWVQRAIMTGLSQYAINTGDNLAHGQPIEDASRNALAPSIASVPFSILGKSGATGGSRGEAARALEQEGIQLTAGQQKGSKALMQFESQVGGAAAQNFRDKQVSQLTRAALKRAGVNADDAGTEVMQKAFDKAGKKFEQLASMTTVKVDPALQNKLLTVATDYSALTGTPAPILEGFVNRVGSIAAQNGGVLKGDNYAKLATDIRVAMESTQDGTLKIALGKLRKELDDAVEGALGGQTKAAWQRARQEYANLKIIQDAVDGAGDLAARGLISPESLSQAVRVGDSTRYVKGIGDLNKLSRDAVVAMPRLPDSGTASRLAPFLTAQGGVANFAHSGDLPSSLALAAAGYAAPFAAGRAVLSAPGRHLLAKGTNIPAAVARGTLPTLAEGAKRLIGG